MKYWWLMIGVSLAGLGCNPPAAPAATAAPAAPSEHVATKAAPEYHYSPFVVQVPESSMVFDTITFKDVGIQRASTEPNDPVLETIAESISYGIQTAPELGVQQSSVAYVEAYSDPANHRSCETEHLYVDVWNSEQNWGYSLWSGCGEADKFAWEQVSIDPTTSDNLTDRVAPLADSITRKLVSAHQHKCFEKHC